MISGLSKAFLVTSIIALSACSQAVPAPQLENRRQNSLDSKPESKPEPSHPAGNNGSSGSLDETADIPKVVNGAYLYCQANDHLFEDKFIVKCQIRSQSDERLDLAREGLSVEFAYEAKEEDGIFVDLVSSPEDKSFDAVYMISGRGFEDLDLFSRGMTFKAEISEVQSGDSRTITLSGDRVTVTIVKTSNPPVVGK